MHVCPWSIFILSFIELTFTSWLPPELSLLWDMCVCPWIVFILSSIELTFVSRLPPALKSIQWVQMESNLLRGACLGPTGGP